MKRKIFTTTALLCCFMVCFAIIADLSGKWTGTAKTPDGNEIPETYNFKVDSGKLKGTVESPYGKSDIAKGVINGSDFTFTTTLNGMEIMHTGKYYEAADSIGMDIEAGEYKLHITLKRSADK